MVRRTLRHIRLAGGCLGGLRGLVVALCLLLACPGAALAQAPVTVDALEFAKRAFAAGEYTLTREILTVLLSQRPDDIEANFLLAELDAQQGDLAAAADRFQKILSAHPNLPRVRLDYALALFRLQDDERAEYNFRLALAAELPDQVRRNVMSYLHAIRQRRRYDINVAASVAPDTNINAATSLNQVTLFGLPFTLAPQAQQKSGIGAVVSLSGEYRYPIGPELRIRSTAALYRADYPGGKFDDMIARVQLGPQLVLQDWDLSVLGVFTERWFGNDPLNTGAGGRIEGAYHGFERWRLESDLEVLRLAYHTQTFQDGDYVATNFYPSYYLSPTAYLRPILGWYWQSAVDPAFAATGYRVGLAYHQELFYGITGEIQPELFLSDYDGTSALFGTTRRDRTIRATFSIYKRDWIIFGFDPVFTYIFTDNVSNQSLFAYRRNQFVIGFTKEF